MNEGSNPYAPPQTDPTDVLDPTAEETLTARFEMTPAFRRAAAHALIMPAAGWLTAAMLVMLVALGVIFSIVGRFDVLPPQKALLLSVIVAGVLSIAYHVGIHEYFTHRSVYRMRTVPALAADGEWVVQITRDELILRSSGGTQSWPLEKLWWHPVRESLVLIQIPRDLPLGIPPNADCGRLVFRDFARAVRKRLRPPGISYFLRD